MLRQEDLLRALGNAKRRRNPAYAEAYRQLVAEARASFPGDAVAQHRAVEAAANRALRTGSYIRYAIRWRTAAA